MANSFIGQSNLPRGLRNNNPGDIKTGEQWQGMVGDDGTFVTFSDITWGTRALATDLANKINEGENTITEIVSIYAPPSENNTTAYIASVSADTGFDPNAVLGMDQATLHALMRAVMNHELGDQYSAMVSDDDIDTGIGMMNSGLLSLFPAAVVAVQTAVANVTGDAQPSTQPNAGVWLVAAGLIGAFWYFSNSSK